MGLDWKAGPLVDHHNPREENQALADLGESFSTIFRWLVVLTILKNMSSSMGRIIPYMKWKIKVMFETTNQSGTTPIVQPYEKLQQPRSHLWTIGRRACVGVRWRATACVDLADLADFNCDVWRFCHQHMPWFNCRWQVVASICHQHICFIGIVDDKHWSI